MFNSIKQLDAKKIKQIEGVFFDIDDTFSSHGKILSIAYSALWRLKDAGLKLVPITGRPAGWCDHIARMWPVDAVVGENGAFYFWYDQTEKKLKRFFHDPEDVRRKKREQLENVKKEILSVVPGAAIASDQGYRETDLAIDFCEDVPALDKADIELICRLFKKHGATCKVSSIHVNGWFGDYSKIEMTRTFVEQQWHMNLENCKDRFIFCGDSPNDEPMFKYFPVSAGVKNIYAFKDSMEHLPAYVAGKEGGEGFAEIAETILESL